MSRLYLPCYRVMIAALVLVPYPVLAVDVDTRSSTRTDAYWPTFRGVDRSATSSDTRLLQHWPEGGPPLVWEARGAGRGYASLAIAGGKLYTLGDGPSTLNDPDEYLICFDLADGKPLWATKTGPAWNDGSPSWQGSRATPTVDGERVYVVSPYGVLLCCNSQSGDELWRRDFKRDFGGKKGDGWGYSESVLIDGDRLICTPGGQQAAMVALNKINGDALWRAERPGHTGAGHSSIVPSVIGGTKVYVQSSASGLMGVRADDGKLLWTFEASATAVIPTPIVRHDLVFFSAGYGCGGALLKQVPTGNGDVKVEEIYPLKRELGSKHGGVVLVGDYLYGDTEDSGVPWCAELMTGNIKWKTRGSGRNSASVAAADGCVYFHFADGTLALVKAAPDAYHELGKFKAPDSTGRPSWSHPVITGGRLFLREGDRILCYDLRG